MTGPAGGLQVRDKEAYGEVFPWLLSQWPRTNTGAGRRRREEEGQDGEEESQGDYR